MKFLVDTNTLSEPAKPAPDRHVLTKLMLHAERIVTASLCVHELMFGAERLPAGARRREYEQFVADLVHSLTVLPYDVGAAAWHAKERARLARQGRTPPFVDGQIAAIATTNDLVLVTKNTADFRHFKEVRVENWARA